MLSATQSFGYYTFKTDTLFNNTTLAFNPKTSITNSNCWVWLDANDLRQSGSVTTWTDKSVNGYNCIQSTDINRPAVNFSILQNKRPTLSFSSASSQYLEDSSGFAIGTNSFYLFIVVKFNDVSSNFQGVFNKSLYGNQTGRIWCYRDGKPLYFGIADSPDSSRLMDASGDTTFNIYALACNRNTARTSVLYKNGTVVQSNSYTTTTTANLTNPNILLVGAYNNTAGTGPHPTLATYFNGNIAEVVGYAPSSDMSVSNIQKVEGYLAWKWGLQSKLPSNHTYYSSPPPA
jgi:hypothetical protein